MQPILQKKSPRTISTCCGYLLKATPKSPLVDPSGLFLYLWHFSKRFSCRFFHFLVMIFREHRFQPCCGPAIADFSEQIENIAFDLVGLPVESFP
jgi:hypothetical protein